MVETETEPTNSPNATVSKKSRMRSPNYPGIGLRSAVDRAKELYNADKRNWAHVDNALGHWGFKPRSGAGLVVLAALRSYGLLEDEGKGKVRRVRITDVGMKLLILDPKEPQQAAERQRLLQTAALKPRVHAELWKYYQGSIPSDSTLKYELMSNRGFTENAVKEFIPQFKSTITFSGLTTGDKLPANEADNAPPPDPFAVPPVTTTPAVATPIAPSSADQVTSRPSTRVVNLPLSGDTWAALQVPVPMSEEDWEQMLAVLNAMKRGIVKKP